MPGVRTNLTLFPDEGVVVTVLANNSATAENSLAPIHDEILRELVGNLVGDPPNASALEAPTPVLRESAAGRWQGTISTWQGDVALSALLAVDGSVVLQYDRAEMVEARSVLQQGDVLVVTGGGAIALTDDLRRAPFEIVLVLRPDGDRLTGRAIARPMRDDERAHFALSHYVELRRES